MTEPLRKVDLFVTGLEELRDDPRGAGKLAALRRGLGKPPGTAFETYPVVIPCLKRLGAMSRYDEELYYLVASLFALHPQSATEGNLGEHLANLFDPKDGPSTSLERRFVALLASHPDDLYRTLEQAIKLLRSNNIPVCWHNLVWHLKYWDDSNHWIQKRWADGFWSRTTPANATFETSETTEEGETENV